MNDIAEKIVNNLKNLGVNISDIESDFILENSIDSITFIEIIISLEEEFSILMPEEYLLMERTNTISKIAAIIEELVRP